MATSNTAPVAAINEGKITFKRVEGHKHDGITSSLIDTSKYSMFDFIASETNQTAKQQNNKNVLKRLIVSTIEERILNPQGIRIQANAITAREIVSGTITANQLAANIVLINNTIRSSNYVSNSTIHTGWIINNTGNAEFNDVTIRGNLIAGDGFYNNSNTSLFANNGGYFSLKDKFAWDGVNLSINANNVTLGSNFTWNGTVLSITGAINATSGTINNTLTVGTNANKISIIGTATAASTAIYSGTSSYGSGGFWLDASGRFSLGNKLSWNGSSLSIAGDVTIGGTTASTVVSNADSAVQPSEVKDNLGGTGNTNISGGIISTGTINLNNVNVRTGTTGARINIDSTGLYAYNSGGTNTVKIGSDGSATFTGSISATTISGSTISGTTVTTGTWGSGSATGLKLDSDGYITGSGGGVKIRSYGTDGTNGVTGTLLFGDSITVPNLYPNYIQVNGNNTWNQNGEVYMGGATIRPLSLERIYTAGAAFMRFYNISGGDSAGVAGSIVYGTANTGRTILINYTSDARLKENIVNIENATAVIKGIHPRSFNFNGSSVRVDGFIAQELYEVYPTSVTVGGDDPQEDPWGVDYATLTPLLTAALKESIAKIEQLEVRIQALEGV